MPFTSVNILFESRNNGRQKCFICSSRGRLKWPSLVGNHVKIKALTVSQCGRVLEVRYALILVSFSDRPVWVSLLMREAEQHSLPTRGQLTLPGSSLATSQVHQTRTRSPSSSSLLLQLSLSSLSLSLHFSLSHPSVSPISLNLHLSITLFLLSLHL